MRNIITSHEVILYSPADASYSVADICVQIQRRERILFKSCWLGLDKYYALVEDLNPLDADAYKVLDSDNNPIQYSLDQRVMYDGWVYVSLSDSNTQHPDDGGWAKQKKFKTDANNEIWENGMKFWLAFEIFHASIAYSTYKAGAKGLTKLKDDGTGIQTVNYNEYVNYKKKVKHDALDQLEVLYDWMVSKNLITQSSGDCGTTTCAPPNKKRRRRWHFKN